MTPFGFGPMSSFYDEDFESAFDPLFLDEFIFYEEDGSYRGECPNCGNRIKIRSDSEKVRCRNCDSKFRVN